MRWEARDTRAQGHPERRRREIKYDVGSLRPQKDPLAQRKRVLQSGLNLDDGELLAPVPRDAIDSPDFFGEQGGNALEHPVPCGMASGVVDVFEVIDVQQSEGKHSAEAH